MLIRNIMCGFLLVSVCSIAQAGEAVPKGSYLHTCDCKVDGKELKCACNNNSGGDAKSSLDLEHAKKCKDIQNINERFIAKDNRLMVSHRKP